LTAAILIGEDRAALFSTLVGGKWQSAIASPSEHEVILHTYAASISSVWSASRIGRPTLFSSDDMHDDAEDSNNDAGKDNPATARSKTPEEKTKVNTEVPVVPKMTEEAFEKRWRRRYKIDANSMTKLCPIREGISSLFHTTVRFQMHKKMQKKAERPIMVR